jgi:MFS family permease
MADSTRDMSASGAGLSLPMASARPRAVDSRSLLRLNNMLQILTNGAWYVGTPFVPLYLVAHGASAGVVGLVVSLSGIAPLAVALHAGGLVDERGPTVVFVISVALFGFGGALLTAFHETAIVTVAYALMTTANVGLAVASQSVVATASTDGNRVANYGHYAVAYSAGAVAGPIVGGFLAARFGYSAAFLAMTLLALPSLTIAALLRNRPIGPRRAVAVGTVHRLVGTIVRTRGVGAILFVTSIMMCAQVLQATFYPLYLSNVGLSATLIGVAIASANLASMAIRVSLVGAVAGLGQWGALVGAIALSGIAFAVTPLLRDFWPLVGVSALMGASLGFTQPLSMSLLAESVADEFRGVAFGIRQSAQRAAGILSPLVFGMASTARGMDSAFYLGGLVLFVGAGLTTKISAKFEHRPDA